MYIIICEIDCQSRFDARGRVLRVHWDDPEGWDEEGGGRGDQDGGHMYPNVHRNTVYNSQDMEAT